MERFAWRAGRPTGAVTCAKVIVRPDLGFCRSSGFSSILIIAFAMFDRSLYM